MLKSRRNDVFAGFGLGIHQVTKGRMRDWVEALHHKMMFTTHSGELLGSLLYEEGANEKPAIR